ncbi:hypothetical protein U9M48_002259 [Paspalum notatum var. saurae]|uniref:Uncharacterized protein n=1 Tax=Paspalum notatum var. saurae TaxID=547442 RepID=A0AAQ3PR00_PASNO
MVRQGETTTAKEAHAWRWRTTARQREVEAVAEGQAHAAVVGVSDASKGDGGSREGGACWRSRHEVAGVDERQRAEVAARRGRREEEE